MVLDALRGRRPEPTARRPVGHRCHHVVASPAPLPPPPVWLALAAVLAGLFGWAVAPALAQNREQGQDPEPAEPAAPSRNAERAAAMERYLEQLAPFAGREIGEVRIEAIRFNGVTEPIRKLEGKANFIEGPEWLSRHILARPRDLLRVGDVRDDLRRLDRTGRFSELRVLARGAGELAQGTEETALVTLIYQLRSKPVERIDVVPEQLVTEGLASFKARLAIKEGEEYTEFKANQDVKNIIQQRPNIADVRVRAWVLQHPDGRFADGLRVEYYLIENMYLDRIEFRGIDRGPGEGDLREALLTPDTAFYNLHTVDRDVRRIHELFREQGFYFVEVEARLREIPREGRGPERVLTFEIEEGPKVEIGSVSFHGLELLVPAADGMIFDMPTEWWELWYAVALWIRDENARRRPFLHEMQGTGVYNPRELDRDRDRIEQILRGNGWLDAKVYLVREAFSPDRSRVDIAYRIEPGPLYTVRSITLRGGFEGVTQTRIRRAMQVREGMTYRKMAVEGRPGMQVEGDQQRIQRLFRDEGYFNAIVELEVIKASPTEIDLVYSVEQGRRVRVGRVNILGNEATKESVIRAELAGAQPGRWYSQTDIEFDTLRLMRRGWFARPPRLGVRILPRPAEEPFDAAHYVDVDVYVEEGETGTFNLGAGWSSERGIVGYLNITKRNFDILDFPRFTGAGQEVSLSAQPGPSSSSYYASFAEPYFFGTRFSFSTSFRYDNQDLPSYKTLDWVYTAGFGYSITPDLVLRLGYTWNWFKAYQIASDASPAIQEAGTSRVYSSLRLGLEFDQRDDIFLPTQGFNFKTSMEVGGNYLGGNVNFWHYQAWASYSIPIRLDSGPVSRRMIGTNPAFTFRVSFDVQSAYGPTDSVPILKRLPLGGSATPLTPAMRGFAEEGVGPRDADGHSLRGSARLVGNVEFRYPIQPGIIYGVVFLDIGQLQLGIDDFALNRWNVSWGFGLRLKVPISPAPLALDFGFPINSFDGDREQLVSFSLGFNF